jgi:WD40 repeat protein
MGNILLQRQNQIPYFAGKKSKTILSERIRILTKSINNEWITAWKEIECHTRYINDILILPEKDIILTGSNDNSISIWRLSFSEKLFTVSKAHDDAVKSIIYHKKSDSIISSGLDKILHFWTLEEQRNRGIFSLEPAIEEEYEMIVDREDENNPNISSLTNIERPNNNPTTKYKLSRKEKLKTDRIIEMKLCPQRPDECFMLKANNKEISHMQISERMINNQYIQENQTIMTFCINSKGTLLITSLVGKFPCFHLWMIDHKSFVGENPFKMFSNRKFYWKTSKLFFYKLD